MHLIQHPASPAWRPAAWLCGHLYAEACPAAPQAARSTARLTGAGAVGVYEFASVPLLALAVLVGWSSMFCWAVEGWRVFGRAKLKMGAGVGQRARAARNQPLCLPAAALPTGSHGGLPDSTAGCLSAPLSVGRGSCGSSGGGKSRRRAAASAALAQAAQLPSRRRQRRL